MSIIDKAIAAISPSWSYHRDSFRRLNELDQRSYDAAKSDRLTSGWNASNASGQVIDGSARDIVRGRARDLERNSDIFNSFLSAFERNVVGEGLKLQVKTHDDKINSEIELAWQEWTQSINCDLSAQSTFNELMRMALRRKKVDGGILIHMPIVEGERFPLKIQLIEVDALCTWAAPKNKSNKVVDGVEIDTNGRHVGYWVNQGDDIFEGYQPMFLPAEFTIAYWSKTRPSQVREISEMAPSLLRIRDMDSFMSIVAEKERIAASMAVAIERNISTDGIGRGSIVNKKSAPKSYDGKQIVPGRMLHSSIRNQETIRLITKLVEI